MTVTEKSPFPAKTEGRWYTGESTGNDIRVKLVGSARLRSSATGYTDWEGAYGAGRLSELAARSGSDRLYASVVIFEKTLN